MSFFETYKQIKCYRSYDTEGNESWYEIGIFTDDGNGNGLPVDLSDEDIDELTIVINDYLKECQKK